MSDSWVFESGAPREVRAGTIKFGESATENVLKENNRTLRDTKIFQVRREKAPAESEKELHKR